MTGPAEPGRRANSARRAEELAHAHIRSLIHDAVKPLTARLDALEQRPNGGVSDEHQREHTHLRATLDKLAGAHDNAPPAFHWDDLDPDEQEQRAEQLRAWVNEVLAVWHPTQARLLLAKPCWWRHLDVRASVHAAWLAWVGSYQADTRKRTDPAEWIGKTLPALEKQTKAALGGPHEPCEDHPNSEEH